MGQHCCVDFFEKISFKPHLYSQLHGLHAQGSPRLESEFKDSLGSLVKPIAK